MTTPSLQMLQMPFAQVYALGNQGVYTLVNDYKALWGFGTGNNTTESVFEIQHTNLVGSDWAENSNDLYYSRKEGNAFSEACWNQRIVFRSPHFERWMGLDVPK